MRSHDTHLFSHFQPTRIIQGVDAHKAGSNTDLLPEVEGTTVIEFVAGHLVAVGVTKGDDEGINEHGSPDLGQHPLKLKGARRRSR